MRKFVRQEDLFLNHICKLALDNRAQFPEDFIAWLKDNLHIWRAFEQEAILAKNRGKLHYSARTIIEWLRHNSALRSIERAPEWKINDRYTPYLARLFGLAHPEHDKFFEYRRTTQVVTIFETSTGSP